MTDALRERETRIAELSGHLLKVQEEERKRISRELHDETGQALMVIRLYLGMLDKAVTTRSAKAKIQELLEVVDRTIEGIRRIIGRLSPLVLQELGLIAAIRKEAKDLAKSSGVNARVAVSDDVGRVAPEVETAIYRVVQESLHNVAKHSNAHGVTIEMHRTENHLQQYVLTSSQQGHHHLLSTQSIDFVLKQEDSTLSGVITNETGDAGGLTRFGLCAKWHPEAGGGWILRVDDGRCSIPDNG